MIFTTRQVSLYGYGLKEDGTPRLGCRSLLAHTFPVVAEQAHPKSIESSLPPHLKPLLTEYHQNLAKIYRRQTSELQGLTLYSPIEFRTLKADLEQRIVNLPTALRYHNEQLSIVQQWDCYLPMGLPERDEQTASTHSLALLQYNGQARFILSHQTHGKVHCAFNSSTILARLAWLMKEEHVINSSPRFLSFVHKTTGCRLRFYASGLSYRCIFHFIPVADASQSDWGRADATRLVEFVLSEKLLDVKYINPSLDASGARIHYAAFFEFGTPRKFADDLAKSRPDLFKQMNMSAFARPIIQESKCEYYINFGESTISNRSRTVQSL